MTIYFCTYFDSRYLQKGNSCYYTLTLQNPDTRLFVVCLDEKVYNIVSKWGKAIAIRLSDLEKFEPELLKAKTNRSLEGYFGTLSPILPLYIFEKYDYVDLLFYTDADIAFWSDPAEMIGVIGQKSLMVIDHDIEPPRNGIRFNVGILGYRNDNNCKEFLYWWRDRCLEWCEWMTLSPYKCGDQGYLNVLADEPNKFKNFLISPHPGTFLAPWNLAKHKVTEINREKFVDGKNLICYHYHEFKFLNSNEYFSTGWEHTKSDKRIIYDTYFEVMKKFI